MPKPSAILLSASLDDEWRVLRRRRDALVRARQWRVTDGPVDDLDDLLAQCGYRRPPDPARNEALRRLVAVARADDLAARVVLQRLLPGLLAAVRNRATRGTRGTRGLFEEVVGAAWISIRTANVSADSEYVAAALVGDAWHRTFTAPRRRRSAAELAFDPFVLDERPAVCTPSAFDELADVVAEARRRGLPREDVELVRALLRAGSPAGVAGERKVTPRTVRNHRDRATYRIRRLTAAA